jgi:AcrR family transcriptional regulator
MSQSVSPAPPSGENLMRERILRAAFEAFAEYGYAATSTLDIATRAKISKRDLYAHFGSKQAVLVACIKRRADRMRLRPDLPVPRHRQMLAAMLTGFATNLVLEISDPPVIAMFRLAVAEAARSPEIARALEVGGREATRGALAELLAQAQAAGLVGRGEPASMAAQFLGLLWEGLMVGLLLGVEAPPERAEAERRAAKATEAFLQLHPKPRRRPVVQCRGSGVG